jgi:hypothetical protein
MSTKEKYKESGLPKTPFLELNISFLDDDERFNIIINYLFDIEIIYKGNKKKSDGLGYKPGFYMEYFKPDLELPLERETDKMYITIRGFDGNRRVLMNPEFMKRINDPELSNNIYEKAILKRNIIETCINNLRGEEFRAILYYFLYPTSTLESKGISVKVAKNIYKFNQHWRVKKLKNSVRVLINEISIYQNKT